MKEGSTTDITFFVRSLPFSLQLFIKSTSCKSWASLNNIYNNVFAYSECDVHTGIKSQQTSLVTTVPPGQATPVEEGAARVTTARIIKEIRDVRAIAKPMRRESSGKKWVYIRANEVEG